ncbi:unnamed protein product, partial [Sphenostylis stenocarpa]
MSIQGIFENITAFGRLNQLLDLPTTDRREFTSSYDFGETYAPDLISVIPYFTELRSNSGNFDESIRADAGSQSLDVTLK